MSRHSSKKLTVKRPAYQVGELVQLTRYIPPILSGTLVRIEAVSPYKDGCRYQVRPEEYQAEAAWVYEDDLAWMLISGEPHVSLALSD